MQISTETNILTHRSPQQVFTWLYDKYWDSLLKYANGYIADRDTCEDIIQKLFIHLFVSSSKLNVNSSISSYLFVALRNRIYNYLRDQAVYKKHTMLAGTANQGWHNNVDQSIRLRDLENAIGQFVNHLPGKYREVYLLHERYHYPVKEISVLLQRPRNTVEKQLRKAMHLLRDHLSNNNHLR
jgi:RNA polymerase sigma factor (sigma-70 family)